MMVRVLIFCMLVFTCIVVVDRLDRIDANLSKITSKLN